MSSPRVIKKYPNRRLYDTFESRYITLADIRKLVIDTVDFRIVDKKTGADITRLILLQVICEQEQHDDAIMSSEFLGEVIRAYDTVVPSLMRHYLEQSVKLFTSQQQYRRGQMQQVAGTDPINSIADLTQKSLSRFQSIQHDDGRSNQNGEEPRAPVSHQKAG